MNTYNEIYGAKLMKLNGRDTFMLITGNDLWFLEVEVYRCFKSYANFNKYLRSIISHTNRAILLLPDDFDYWAVKFYNAMGDTSLGDAYLVKKLKKLITKWKGRSIVTYDMVTFAYKGTYHKLLNDDFKISVRKENNYGYQKTNPSL